LQERRHDARPEWRNGRRGSLKNCWGATPVSVRVRPSAPKSSIAGGVGRSRCGWGCGIGNVYGPQMPPRAHDWMKVVGATGPRVVAD
jgi:hypothetical protein